MNDVAHQTDNIKTSIETISQYASQLGDDSNSLNDSVTSTQEVEININGLKQNSNSMMEISDTFINETTSAMQTVEEFNQNISMVIQNSAKIKIQNENLTTDLNVANGKIDHIALKKAIMRGHWRR